MPSPSLEKRLSILYKQAVNERRWDIAEHLFSAIEACATTNDKMSGALSEAYVIAARAMASQQTPVARSELDD